jgi:TetR/AcrR family transcriptional regulator, transcriptional repressor of bet genes
MGRPSNTAERREQIAAALLRVMATQGYERATIGDIARVAELTPSLIHYHFENKQAILLEALHHLAARHAAGLERRLADAALGARAELDAFIDFHLGLGADADPEALSCWVLMSGEAMREPVVRVEYERALADLAARLIRILRRGAADGAFACPEPDAAASALIAAIQGYFVLAAAARPLIPRGTAAACVKRMADGLLTPPQGSRKKRT